MRIAKLPTTLLFILAPLLVGVEPAASAEANQAIINTVKKRMPSFKLCFDDALKRKGHLEGKVVIGFEVGADGRVTRSKVEQDNIADPEVGCCAALLMRRIKFEPPAQAPVRESFPFVFVNPNAPGKPPKNPPPPTTYCADLKKLDAPAPAAP
ncbi:MAG: AgmX/PglI C-terminal domain-containing protein [Myxococcota bacterium]